MLLHLRRQCLAGPSPMPGPTIARPSFREIDQAATEHKQCRPGADQINPQQHTRQHKGGFIQCEEHQQGENNGQQTARQ